MESEAVAIRKHLAPALVSLGLVLLLLGIDVGLGYRKVVAADEEEQIEGVHQPDPRLGWALQPGSRGRHVSPGEFAVEYGIDPDGLRHVANRGAARERIWVFGDSFTFGHGVPDDATYTSVMASRLLAPGVHVMNAGVMGYGLVQELQRLAGLADRIEPGDLVLFAPISNDLERSFKHFRYPSRQLLRRSKGHIEHYPDLQGGRLVTVTLDTPWNRLKALLFQARFTGAGWQRLFELLDPPPVEEEAHAVIEEARRIAHARGARFALLFLPHPEECLERRYRVDLSGFDFPDLMRFFPADREGIDSIHFPGDTHWNARGHAMAARAIVETLLAQGVLTPEEVAPESGLAPPGERP